MKVTKSQLMQIIKEEILSEASVGFSDAQKKEYPGIGTPGFQGSSLSPEEEAAVMDEMDVGIAREFAGDVIEYVRQEIIPEQAPALASMSMGDFLRLAADMAPDEPMAVDPWRNK